MIPKDFPWTAVPLKELPFVVLDLETTGFEPGPAGITEIAMITLTDGREERFETLINPEVPIPAEITKLTGITADMVLGKPTIGEVIPYVASILQDSIFVSHNVPFDWGFLDHAFQKCLGTPLRMPSLCTLRLARRFLNLPSNRLEAVARSFGVDLTEAHRAMGDTQAVTRILWHFLDFLDQKGIKTGGDLVRQDLLFLSAPPPQRRFGGRP